jgi:16S rRNA (cytosine1407-C5)-methyltransferase
MQFLDMISQLLHGDKQAVASYTACQSQPLSKTITIMESRIFKPDFFSYTQKAHRSLTSMDHIGTKDSYSVQREDITSGLWKHRLHTCGYMYIQESAASMPPHFLIIPPGWLVLDMCAAPGGKSTQIADTLLKTSVPWLVVCNEINAARRAPLQSNINRMWAYNTAITHITGEKFGILLPDTFDAVLIDAPCSGEGTGFKSDAWTKRRREETIHSIARLQKELIISGINACKPWGSIVYATCTLNPWENEYIVKHALDYFGDAIKLCPIDLPPKTSGITTRGEDIILSPEQAWCVARFWPHIQKTGGFFIAAFRKKEQAQSERNRPRPHGNSTLDTSPRLQQTIANALQDDFGITINASQYFFVATDKQVYVTSPCYMHIHNTIHIEKTGIPIYKKWPRGELRPLHGLGQVLWTQATHHLFPITAEQLQIYSEWYDLDIPDSSARGFCIITIDGRWVSVGKITGTTLKNKFQKF